MVWMGGWNVAIATIVANLIGGCIFFWVDSWIFKEKKVVSRTKELAGAKAVISDEEKDLS